MGYQSRRQECASSQWPRPTQGNDQRVLATFGSSSPNPTVALFNWQNAAPTHPDHIERQESTHERGGVGYRHGEGDLDLLQHRSAGVTLYCALLILYQRVLYTTPATPLAVEFTYSQQSRPHITVLFVQHGNNRHTLLLRHRGILVTMSYVFDVVHIKKSAIQTHSVVGERKNIFQRDLIQREIVALILALQTTTPSTLCTTSSHLSIDFSVHTNSGRNENVTVSGLLEIPPGLTKNENGGVHLYHTKGAFRIFDAMSRKVGGPVSVSASVQWTGLGYLPESCSPRLPLGENPTPGR
ncbi:hypothetical protein J6590_004834 [Homalodisca vitripennis]|nr:hypothetical protein J6590_004834 [Homalodisca vitripennis]